MTHCFVVLVQNISHKLWSYLTPPWYLNTKGIFWLDKMEYFLMWSKGEKHIPVSDIDMKHYTHNYPFDSNRSQVQGEITNFFHWFYHNAIYHLKTFTNSQKMCVEEKAKWMKHDFIFYIHLRIYNIMYNLIFINIILFPPVPCWVKLHKGTKNTQF